MIVRQKPRSYDFDWEYPYSPNWHRKPIDRLANRPTGRQTRRLTPFPIRRCRGFADSRLLGLGRTGKKRFFLGLLFVICYSGLMIGPRSIEKPAVAPPRNGNLYIIGKPFYYK